jgi:hypothetical protein
MAAAPLRGHGIVPARIAQVVLADADPNFVIASRGGEAA